MTSLIELLPLDGGEKFAIPEGKVVIGRGPLLQIIDKRVSRNHATLHTDDEGQLVITPIHTNPCFLQSRGSNEHTTLQKDKPIILNHLDVVGLLPDRLNFKVVYTSKQNEEKSEAESKNDSETDQDTDEEKDKNEKVKTCDSKTLNHSKKNPAIHSKDAKANSLDNQISPCNKLRNGLGENQTAHSKPNLQNDKVKVSQNAANTTPSRGRGRPPGSKNKNKPQENESPAPVAPVKPKLTQPKKIKEKMTENIPQYKDDIEEDSGPEVRGPSDESDVANFEEDSGSDWESGNKKSKHRPLTIAPKVASPRGRGRIPKVKSPVTTSGRKRRRNVWESDEEDYIADFFDNYIPRPSKRRAAATTDQNDTVEDVKDELPCNDDNDNDNHVKLTPKSSPSSDPVHTNLDDDDEPEPEKYQPERTNNIGRGTNVTRGDTVTRGENVSRGARRGRPPGAGRGRGRPPKNSKTIDNSSSDIETPIKIPKKRPYVKSPKKDKNDEKPFEESNSPSSEAVVSPTGRTKRAAAMKKTNFSEDYEWDNIESDEERSKYKTKNSNSPVKRTRPEEIDSPNSPSKNNNESPNSKENKEKLIIKDSFKVSHEKNGNGDIVNKAKLDKTHPRSSCAYGQDCYRKDPIHFEQFAHPGDSSYDEDDSEEEESKQKDIRSAGKVSNDNNSKESFNSSKTEDFKNDSFCEVTPSKPPPAMIEDNPEDESS